MNTLVPFCAKGRFLCLFNSLAVHLGVCLYAFVFALECRYTCLEVPSNCLLLFSAVTYMYVHWLLKFQNSIRMFYPPSFNCYSSFQLTHLDGRKK